ncbi:MAG: type II secretion system protein N [Candidatus Omnitrophica bacterium]|nr:type II secretion system protein N [Candidatus Omnitrophota bacterium]
MKDNISPEEKLLRLIKGDKNKPVEKKDIPAPKVSVTTQRFKIDLQAKDLIALFSGKIKFVLIAVSLVYLIASFVYPLVSSKNINLPVISAKAVKEEQTVGIKKESKPFEYYLKDVVGRQIFGDLSEGQEGPGAAAVAAEADSIKDINLLGVVLGDNPQAIIEDKKSQKTIYVNRGQFIGQFQVEEIKEGKVILNYKGQRYELGV